MDVLHNYICAFSVLDPKYWANLWVDFCFILPALLVWLD